MEIGKHRIESLWKAIDEQLLRKYPEYAEEPSFLPAAIEKSIQGLESLLGVTLPDEYRNSLGIHEGTASNVWLWDAVSLSGISTVIEDRKAIAELVSHPNNSGAELVPHGPVRRCMFDALWIPFANDNGIPICLDLNPLPGGVVGQIIYVDWEDGTVRVIANSFIDFLEDGLAKMRKL